MSARPPRVDKDLPPGIEEFFDEKSMEVLRCFGLDTPDLLNNYCCAVEDALIKVVQDHKHLKYEHNKLTARFSVLMGALKETSAADEVDEINCDFSGDNASDQQ